MKNKESEIAEYYFKPPSLWESIPKHIYEEFKAHSTTTKLKRNEIIYSEGTYPKGLYILTKGCAKLYTVNNVGREQIIYFMKKNEMFGYRAIACNNNSVIFISAIEDCEIELIDRDVFLSYLFKSMELNKLFMNYLGDEFRILYHKISVYALKPVSERVALTLLVLDQKFNTEEGKDSIDLFMRRDIANYAGITIETLSRQLKVLTDGKVIKTKGKKITITNFDALYIRANI